MMNNLTAKTEIVCGICGKQMTILGLGRHLKTHNICPEAYYKTYLAQSDEGICHVCGQPSKFINFTFGYNTYCSKSCANYGTQSRRLETMARRYGVEYASQSKELLAKIKQTNIKTKGVEWAFHTDDGKQQAKKNSHTEDARQKWLNSYQQTCLERYGVEHYAKTVEARKRLSESTAFHSQEVIEKAHAKEANKKRQQTLLDKYGVDHPFKLESANIRKNSSEARRKAWKTGHTNGNSSTVEDNFENRLKEFGYVRDKDYIREYKSDSYPFNCDFYLVSQELYVELNIHWTHGYHAFDPNNVQDMAQLHAWQEKNSPFYQKAIDVWTVKDPMKFEYARNHALNYIVLWNTEDIDRFFATLTPIGGKP